MKRDFLTMVWMCLLYTVVIHWLRALKSFKYHQCIKICLILNITTINLFINLGAIILCSANDLINILYMTNVIYLKINTFTRPDWIQILARDDKRSLESRLALSTTLLRAESAWWNSINFIMMAFNFRQLKKNLNDAMRVQ